MGVVRVNDTEAGGSSCEIPETGDEFEGKILRDGSWWKVAADRVIQVSETQPICTYLNKRQVTVA